jgi:hypothetical protein
MDNSQLFVLLTKLDSKLDDVAMKTASIPALHASIKSLEDDVQSIKQVIWYNSDSIVTTLESQEACKDRIDDIEARLDKRADKYWGIVSGIISLVLGLLINTTYFSPKPTNSATIPQKSHQQAD